MEESEQEGGSESAESVGKASLGNELDWIHSEEFMFEKIESKLIAQGWNEFLWNMSFNTPNIFIERI